MIAHAFALLVALLDARAGVATTFGPSSMDAGNPDDSLACSPRRRLSVRDLVVASYALPCGARVLVYAPRTGRAVVATVADRGPVRTRRRPELQRTDLDLAIATARAIGAGGREVVWWGIVP